MIDPIPNPELDAAMIGDDEAAIAKEFQRTFMPLATADYSWVEQYAKGQYDLAIKTFADLDTKATAIIGYLTSATGLFTIGTLAAVSAAKLPPAVVAWAIPSVLCSIVAIVLAALARRPRNIFPPPRAQQMVAFADQYSTETDARGRALMIPMWEWSFALLRRPLAIKAAYLDWATWLMIAAVSLLLLPLFASL